MILSGHAFPALRDKEERTKPAPGMVGFVTGLSGKLSTADKALYFRHL